MSIKEIKNEIDALITKIKQWNYEYYVLNQSSVSDAVYDQYYQKLLKLEKEYPHLVKSDSPTKTVGSIVNNSKLRKINHKTPMLSLSNAFDKEDLAKFDQQVKKLTGLKEIEYVCELKIDGLSISLTYEYGKLKLAATRGDGVLGEDISENIKAITTVPTNLINNNLPLLEVRGEVFLSKQDFNNLNEQQKNNNNITFANPRNAASGTLRQLDTNVVKERNLNAFLYYYVNALKDGIFFHDKALEKLQAWKFNVNKEWKLCKNIEEVYQYIIKYQSQRNNLDYEIDGIVIKVNDLRTYELLGNTNKAPRWAIAYKFPAITTTTKLLKIFPTVGRTGKITYNAQLEPVLLSGSTISYATLHNADYIANRDLRENDIVEIKKAGDVIPEVIKTIVELRKEAKKFHKVLNCPECNSVLEQVTGEVDQYCINSNCSARIFKSLVHFTSRDAMDITGLSEKTLEKFINLQWINNVSDIYNLINYRKEILDLAKFGEKSFNNLVTNIINSKQNSLEKLIFGLGIRHIGQKTSKILAQKFITIDKLMLTNFDELAAIKDIGATIAQSIVDYFANEQNLNLISKLQSFGVNFTYIGTENDNNKLFANQIFVITGTLTNSRTYYVNLLENLGANISNSISKNTNYLLVGQNPGSKVQKAEVLKVKIISEIDLNNLINKK